MFCVYKHTTPNGKVYIGITSKNPLVRWKNGHGYKNNLHFWNAIIKYGWDNIKHEILFDGLTKEKACEIEIQLINQYRSNEFEFGYNSSTGGELSAAGCKWTEEHKRKTSFTLMGHAVSEQTKEKIKAARKNQTYFGVCNPKCGKDNPKARNVIQMNTSGEIVKVYETIKQAAKDNLVCHQSISDCCRGKLKTVKGFVFIYGQGE